MTRAGTLYGLGVGPGDPELITLKAWRILSLAPVVAYPETRSGASLARGIAAPFLPEGVTELPIALPMCEDREPARAAYDEAAGAIASHLREGRDVALLCEGDPFFYGSFMYLFGRLAREHNVEVVPGVTSLTASAAALGRPLAARNDLLKVIPAPLDEARLSAEIAQADSVAIIKVGRHFDKVRRVLRDLGLAERATIVESATGDGEKISPLEDVPEGKRPYFSTILLYKGGEPW
jgi:precorrin-2/cobalt-factor-2 C20-methyltransferase